MGSRIEDYALIGDCESAALIGRDGSIDWLCWPRFDSSSIFAALLGDRDHGRWLLRPQDAAICGIRKYIENTLVLESELETPTGCVRITDFMPLQENGTSNVVRIVTGLRGVVEMHMELSLRFDYGSTVPWVVRGEKDGCTLRAIAGPDKVTFYSGVPITGAHFQHTAEFPVREGEVINFVLSYGSSFKSDPKPVQVQRAFEHTVGTWQSWAGRYRYGGLYSREVLRSLITLKALTYAPTGGIIAAVTTSLPEKVGGARNWDYRYCWLRDSTFALQSLLNSGFIDEARSWQTWLRHSVAGDPAQVQIMYGLAGERRLDEWEIPWLPGYENSRPVRIGNDAAKQVQLDIYGEVLDAFYQSVSLGMQSETTWWDLQSKLVEHLEATWEQKDEGLWEVRGGRRHFTHSKIMAWVAFDRAVKSIENFNVEGPLERWRAVRDRIHAEICANAFNTDLGSFVQSYGSSELDASALLIPLVGFLPPTDPRVISTIAAVEKNLMIDGLVHRYDTGKMDDGLPTGEGAFLACSFWFADNLILTNRRDEARDLFQRLLSICNDVGLLAEEYDPIAKRMLGNFPQAFSHIALINTAHNLVAHEKPAEQRSGNRSA